MQQNDKANHVLVTINEKLARLSPSSSECCILKVHNHLHEVNSKVDEPDIITIGEKLARFSPSSSECCIFKVHNQLREVNSKAYEPDIVAIGPYHRGKDKLKMMEEHKLRYLHFRLEEKKEKVERYVDALQKLEGKARKYYAETLNLDTNEMIEMILLDGFFIIELFRKFNRTNLRERNDSIFQMSWIVNSLKRDLMLFENQLPFFILCELFDMIEKPDNHPRFIYLARTFFSSLYPGPGHESKYYSDGDQSKKISHLLELVHDAWLPSYVGKPDIKEKATTDSKKKWWYIQCATKLGEAGITFEKKVEKKDDPQSLFDINFKSGVMQIPTLIVEDGTDSFFRNLVAYELYGRHKSGFNFVTDYLTFMDCLINSSKDVTLLCGHEIIDNWLGDDEVVSTLFNKITDFVTGPNEHFRYAQICEEVNIHCSKQRNRWMANLWRNHLSSPWTIISLLAAFFLLGLTITQTVFAVISYSK